MAYPHLHANQAFIHYMHSEMDSQAPDGNANQWNPGNMESVGMFSRTPT